MQTIRHTYQWTFFSLLCPWVSASFISTVRYALSVRIHPVSRQAAQEDKAVCVMVSALPNIMVSASRCPMLPIVLGMGMLVSLFLSCPCSSMGNDHWLQFFQEQTFFNVVCSWHIPCVWSIPTLTAADYSLNTLYGEVLCTSPSKVVECNGFFFLLLLGLHQGRLGTSFDWHTVVHGLLCTGHNGSPLLRTAYNRCLLQRAASIVLYTCQWAL